MVDSELLKLLCCPETHQAMRLVDALFLGTLNEKIGQGVICNRGGRRVADQISNGLLRADGKVLYPIRNDIPVMLIEEGIEMDQEPTAKGIETGQR